MTTPLIKKLAKQAASMVPANRKSFPCYMDEDLLNALNRLCASLGMSRNGFVVHVCEQAVKEWEGEFSRNSAPIPKRRKKQ